MSKSIDTLVEDILAVLDPNNDHIVNEDNLDALGEAVKEAVRRQLRTREERGKDESLRFSNIGKQPRQIWYEAHLPKSEAEQMQPSTIHKFMYGDMVEALSVFLIKEAGHEVTEEQAEVEVDGVKGHLDLIVDGVVLDVKSASPFGFKKFQDGELLPEKDSFGYLHQLAGYANCKDKPAAFFVVNKVSGEIALSPISSYTIKGYPPEPRIRMLKEVIARDQPPERCFEPVPDGKSGNLKLGTECGYCVWKKKCYPNLRGFAYSNGPRYLVKVAKVPDVPEFEL